MSTSHDGFLSRGLKTTKRKGPSGSDTGITDVKSRSTLDIPTEAAPGRDRKGSWLSSLKRPKRFSFRNRESSSSKGDAGRENQLQAYTAWINSYLCRVPGANQVTDLQTDLADGLTLVNLVELVAGETIVGIDRAAASQSARRQNTQLVIQFMHSHRVKMHHTNAKDVVDGNLKSIMRLVLALAAHYRPSMEGGGGADLPAPSASSSESSQASHASQPPPARPKYPLYVDQVPVMENSPRRSRSTVALSSEGAAAGSDPMLRAHDTAGIQNHAYRRRSERHSMIVSPSRSPTREGELPRQTSLPGATVPVDAQHESSSSEMSSDLLSPMDTSALRTLTASPGGRKGYLHPADMDRSAIPDSPEKIVPQARSRSYTELPSSRPQNRWSMIEQLPQDAPMTPLSPVREGMQAGGTPQHQPSQQEQRQLAARELALEGLTMPSPTHSATGLTLSRSTTAPLFNSVQIPPRHVPHRPKTPQFAAQPALSGELLVKHFEMEEDVRNFKEMLYELQHSLLTGLPADLASVHDLMDMPDEVVLLQARLDQKNRAIDRLEEQLVGAELERDQLKVTPSDEATTTAAMATSSSSSNVLAPMAGVVLAPSPSMSRRSQPSPKPEKKASSGSAGKPLDALSAYKDAKTAVPSIQVTSGDGLSATSGDGLSATSATSTDGASAADSRVKDLEKALEEHNEKLKALEHELQEATQDKRSMKISMEEAEKEVVEKKQTLILLNEQLEAREEEVVDLKKKLKSAGSALQEERTKAAGDADESSRPASLRLSGASKTPSESPPLPSERLQGVGADDPDSIGSRPSSKLSFSRSSPPLHIKGLERMAYNQVGSALEAVSVISQGCKLPEEFMALLATAHEDLLGALEKLERSAKSPAKRRKNPSRDGSPIVADPPLLPLGSPLMLRQVVGEESPRPAMTSSLSSSAMATTVLYFMDSVDTPFKTSIQRRPSTVTLRDFKDTIDRSGLYRYHFKTRDPEFGIVKEELTIDADRLPLWDGRVVAWIEEDASIV